MKGDLKRFLSRHGKPAVHRDDEITYFTAHRDGPLSAASRRMCIAPPTPQYGWNRAYFGYFDCADDARGRGAAARAAEDWAPRAANEITGNFNLTAMQQIGVMTGGFDRPPYTDLVYSPPHMRGCWRQRLSRRISDDDIRARSRRRRRPPVIGPRQQAILDNRATSPLRRSRGHGRNSAWRKRA